MQVDDRGGKERQAGLVCRVLPCDGSGLPAVAIMNYKGNKEKARYI